jgi:hypothetical protein
MKKLYDAGVAAEMNNRVHQLTHQSVALWGKMSTEQMLSHVQVPMKLALGDIRMRRHIFGYIFGPKAKQQLLKEIPFAKNLPTDPRFKRKGNDHNFLVEKNRVMDLLDRFVDIDPAAIGRYPHPFFGTMTQEEWGVLLWKHLDHHLQQFGV